MTWSELWPWLGLLVISLLGLAELYIVGMALWVARSIP